MTTEERLDALEQMVTRLAVAVQARPAQPRPRDTVSTRILRALEADPSRLSWSERHWAAELRCSKTAVHNSRAMRGIREARLQLQAEAAERLRERSRLA